MKIAKCKCGAEPIFLENGPRDYRHAYCCQQCKAWMHWVNEKEEARRLWNSLNTDQYGQQLTEQNITWVEWDGDVEHLPKIEGTPILVKFLKYNAINSGVLKFDFSDDEVLIGARIIYPESGGYDPIEKGDQFAVVGEDSHAS